MFHLYDATGKFDVNHHDHGEDVIDFVSRRNKMWQRTKTLSYIEHPLISAFPGQTVLRPDRLNFCLLTHVAL